MALRRLLLVFVLGIPLGAPIACKSESDSPRAAPPAQPVLPPKPLAYAPRVEVAVTEEGFVPSKIPARAGEALTLVITRQTDKTCATDILFHGQDGKTPLPLGKPVEVTYTPTQSGVVRFGCAMGMMVGGVLEVAP